MNPVHHQSVPTAPPKRPVCLRLQCKTHQPPSTGKELPCPPRERHEPTAVTPPGQSRSHIWGSPIERQPEMAARQRSGAIVCCAAPTVLVTALGDGPIAVSDPVGDGEAESAVVAAGDDHIPDTGLIPVGQSHLGVERE